MKKYIAFAAFSAAMTFHCMILAANDFSSLMDEAAEKNTIEERFPLWDKAIDAAATPEERADVLRISFETAKKLSENALITKYGLLLADEKTLSQKERTSVYYDALKAKGQASLALRFGYGKDGGSSPEDWEKYLAMPEKEPKQELDAIIILADSYFAAGDGKKCIENYRRAMSHPSATVFDKSRVTTNLSMVYNLTGRSAESKACLEELLKLKLPGERKAEAFIVYGDSILKGCGYYFEPSEADYEAAYKAYGSAMEMPGVSPNTYFTALLRKNQNLLDRKKYKEALELAKNSLSDRKHKPGKVDWNDLMTIVGKANMGLKNYPDAIEAYEQVVKINARANHGDSQRWLGHAYYKNGDYALAIAMYDYALEALQGAEDDRPDWCEAWIKKLQWYTNRTNAAQLDTAMSRRRAKLLAQSKELGVKTGASKTAADGVNPMARPKKQKKEINSIEDIEKQDKEEDLLADGLDLDAD